MRVAVVCPYDLGRPGGVQAQTIQLSARLSLEGDEALLVGPGTTGPDGAILLGATHVLRANRSTVPLALSPAVIGRVRRAVADVDVVHIHEPLMPMVSLAALRAGPAVVATFHAAPPRWVVGLYRLPGLVRLLSRGVVTAVSEPAARAARRLFPHVEVIPLGLDTGAFELDLPRSEHRVVFVGRDDPRKGLDVLLAAWPSVRKDVADAELVVVGAAPMVTMDGVRFMGRVDEAEKRRQLASAVVLCAPNLGGESFGLVVAEGMAAGCAVLASDLEAFRLVTGGAARLVRPGSPGALARAIVELLGDIGARRRLAALGRERVSRFDWSVVVPRYRAAYKTAMATR